MRPSRTHQPNERPRPSTTDAHPPPDETSAETVETRAKLTGRRGNFYYGLGFALLVGLLVVVGLGVVGVPSLGILSVTTAMAMIAIAITMLALVSFVTLVSLRRTFDLLGHQERALELQANRHADLAAQVQAQWQAEQVIRDRDQDADVSTLWARQDAGFADVRARDAARGRRAGGARSATDPFTFGQTHPVRDIEGVGEHYAAALIALGLTNTHKLWNADTAYVAGAVKVAPAVVEGWQSMAELMAVTGIGKQYAELLVRARVLSIGDLAAASARPLVARIHRLEDRLDSHDGGRVQGNTIGLKIVESWITAAQSHLGQGETNGATVPHGLSRTPGMAGSFDAEA